MASQGNQQVKINGTIRDKNHCVDFKHYFNWFDMEFTTNLTSASKTFLNIDINFYLMAILNKPGIHWKGNDYFVSQIELAPNAFLYIRLADLSAQIILDKLFGKREETHRTLQLKNITELEAKILTSYNEFLFKNLKNCFKEKKGKNNNIKTDDLIHLTFYLYTEDFEKEGCGKIIFSFPRSLLKSPQPVSPREKPLNVMNFTQSFTEVDIFVGKSKISLEDIKHLEIEDIIILENSNLHHMKLKGTEELIFNVNPDPRMVIEVETEGGNNKMNETESGIKNIWDSLQVEVSAEFNKIKMSLGELKQITEGLVIDVAPIVQNKIFINVEEKQIAEGELVIIDDKYGIKITKVFDETTEEQTLDNKNIDEENEDDSEIDTINSEEDELDEIDDSDFDYNDFEIEDDI